jgi:drug/metabolite transporter (DMT)-like permease
MTDTPPTGARAVTPDPALVSDRRGAAGLLRPAILASLGVVYLVWGSTYIALRIGVCTMPPLSLSGVRFLVAGLLLYGWTAWRRRREPGRWAVPTRRQWVAATILGLALPAAGTGGATWAEQELSSGTAALLLATIPLWMTVAGRIVDGDPIRVPMAIGSALGLLGVAALVNPFTGGAPDPQAAAVALGGAMCWGCGSVYARRAPHPSQPLLASGMEMICAGAALLVLGGAGGEFSRIDRSTVSTESLLALAYLVVMGSLLAYTTYEWLNRNAPGQLVGTYAFVNPLVAVLLGWSLLDEPLTGRMALAATVIVVGVALIVATTPARPARGSSPSADVRQDRLGSTTRT